MNDNVGVSVLDCQPGSKSLPVLTEICPEISAPPATLGQLSYNKYTNHTLPPLLPTPHHHRCHHHHHNQEQQENNNMRDEEKSTQAINRNIVVKFITTLK